MPREIHLDLIDRIRIAAPCSAKWDDMTGSDAVRHCQSCDLDVHNFAAMTRNEIAALLGASDGRVCVRLYRRPDGMILTADCPVGLRAIRKRAVRRVVRIAAAVAVLLTALFLTERTRGTLRQYQPFARLCDKLSPQQPQYMPMMGVMIAPAPATSGGTDDCTQ